MNKFFSISNRGFYPPEFRSDYDASGTWPVDGVEVDAATELQIHDAIERGDTIARSGAGFTFTPAPPPPFAPIAAAYLDTVRAVREKILNRLPGIGFAALMAGDTSLAQAVDKARKALLAIPSAPAVLEAADLNGLKVAVLATYRAIVAAAPAELVKAFDAEGL